MKWGVINSKDLGSGRIPGTRKGSWLPEDNVPDICIVNAEEHIAQCNEKIDEYDRRTINLNTEISEKEALIRAAKRIKKED